VTVNKPRENEHMLTCKLHFGSYESTTALNLNKILIKIFSQIGLFEKKDLKYGGKVKKYVYVCVIFSTYFNVVWDKSRDIKSFHSVFLHSAQPTKMNNDVSYSIVYITQVCGFLNISLRNVLQT